MPLTDLSAGSDWNSPYRMPPGWTTLPDGSVGPSSQLPDWLKQLIPSPGAATPYGPQSTALAAGPGPGGVMPGGGLMGRQAATPGAPSMGFPAQAPPQGAQGQIDPAQLAGAGAMNPLAALGNFNPYARAAIAGAGVMAPTPTAGPQQDQAPTNMWMQRPSGVGGMPGPQVTNPGMPSRPYTPTPQNFPSWPSGAAASATNPATTMANAPPGNPSQTPRPNPPMPPRRPRMSAPSQAPAAAPASNPRFSTVQYQVPGSGGPLSRSPIYTALNLFGARS